ncbi:hypothetical protein ACFL9T_03715 [Thermodesulfobacteriota bacterium]
MPENQDRLDSLWEKGWDGHEKAQFLRMAGLSFEEKIRWLEETQEMFLAFERNRSLPHKNPPPE